MVKNNREKAVYTLEDREALQVKTGRFYSIFVSCKHTNKSINQ